MASRVWSNVYGLSGGIDTRCRIPMGQTAEGEDKNGKAMSADHFAQVVDAVPASLDAEGLTELAAAKPTLEIEFRSKHTNGGTVRQKATGDNAKARIAGLIRSVEEAPVESSEGEETERTVVNANGTRRTVNA